MMRQITILGAGPGGYVAAIRAAQLGARVTVVEDAEVGGTCLNRGCIPTKTIIASADALDRVRRAADYGIQVPGEVSFDLNKVRERKDKVVSTQVKGIRNLFKSWGISLVEGRGSLLSNDTTKVIQRDGTTLDIKSDSIIIATGSRPAGISGIPIDGNRIMTSDDALRLSRIPASILIVGAGVIGCEFAFLYRSFGAEVTVVEMMPRALMTEDQEISAVIEREMKKAKIKLITNVTVKNAVASDTGVKTVLSSGQEINSEQVLVSIGRSFNSESIGLEAAGIIKGKRGEIVVNERMETNVNGIYAIGDVTGKILLAHVASHQGLVAVQNALGHSSVMDYSTVPSAVFTAPEIGSVGLREQQALEQGLKYRVGRFQFRGLGKAHAMGEITGIVKVLSDADTDRIIGVHICGAHATDLVHEGVLAMKMRATARELGSMIHAHPTMAEAIMEAAEDIHKLSIHTPRT